MLDIPIYHQQNTYEDYQKHSSYHRMLLDIYVTYIIEIRIVLIREPVSLKHNVYVIDYPSHAMHYKNADEIVCNLDAIPLENAQRLFPEWGFDQENYGF